ncbi:16S rRNA (adenine1518-N6/adenine1519-N6)-dimethyltransferase [Methanohalophilus levihalophilus]|uniref:16S rRNA (adenine(1518)-N(6)/adenine(1519)-N(6))- dimethyltransferase RsmA n=1 Tax=Methanohalophilus levihalophilus TaxID=1431282 RepID=UPI001AE59DE8|nr:16S rRNA (adenine(1518)-N(6)/adenine(1519)-N(6))-dimethyltransferase RsmA [Methanohalophilus levihalophilus]MBP2029543.1 16S rRNA (adenine1518-N6/adenine1519-N6)-dimethyltransferase [Methanohalophilus levihalophilus]
MVRDLLVRYGVTGGSHDQHFLIDEDILDLIADAANLSKNDHVLEIGGGIGNLTQRLLKKAGKVTVIEYDPYLVDVLNDRFGDMDNFEVIHGDAVKVDLPSFNKVVANLPYSISSPITFRLLKHGFDLAVLMYQYEFAKRMISPSGSKEYGRLSVGIQHYADADIIIKISPSAFSPRPEVWSAVIRLEPHKSPFPVKDEEFFLKLVEAAFSQRRKKLKNAISRSIPSEEKQSILNQLPESLMSKRAEELSPEDFASLANTILELKEKAGGI